jgi:hypothetical protein
MNRYEQIFMALVAAEVSRFGIASEAADNVDYYAHAAAQIEEHFQARDLKLMKLLDDVPALLKRQAE